MELVKSKVEFDKVNHKYWFGEKELRGITWILRKYVKPTKYEGIPEYVLQKAANKGSAIHEEIEFHVSGFTPSVHSEEFDAFLKGTESIKFIASEYTVSDNSDFASNIDLVDDKGNLYDIKTTSELDMELLAWQLSIYSYFFELQNKKASGKLYAIWLRGGSCKIVEVEKIEIAKVIDLLKCAKDDTEWSNPVPQLVTLDNEKLAALRQIEMEIANCEQKVKEYKVEQERIKDGLLEIMKAHNVKKYEGDLIMLTYVAPSTRTSIDSKKLKEELPDIYEQFSKTSDVKESLRITIKK